MAQPPRRLPREADYRYEHEVDVERQAADELRIDDECDLPTLLDLFDRYFTHGDLTTSPRLG